MRGLLLGCLGVLLIAACGTDEPPPDGTGGVGSTTAGEAGAHPAGDGGNSSAGAAGVGSSGRDGDGGDAGDDASGGSSEVPDGEGGDSGQSGGGGVLSVGGGPGAGGATAGPGGSGGQTTGSGGTSGGTGASGSAGATAGTAGTAGSGGGACVFFVNKNAGADENPGTSWGAAVATLTRGLELASEGCEVWIAGGTYSANPVETVMFHVPNGVTLRGGFAGTESSRTERADDGFETRLSAGPTVFDDTLRVVLAEGAAVLDRLTIQGGKAKLSIGMIGAGVTANGSLTLEDCVIQGNEAESHGGGVLAYGGVTARNTSFVSNWAEYSGEAKGGAIAAFGAAPLVIENCYFEKNRGINGAAIYVEGAEVWISNSTFVENSVGSRGGAIYAGADSALLVTDSIFRLNSALAAGGAVFMSGPSLLLTSSELTGNGAGQGAAVFSILDSSDLLLTHVTIAANEGDAVETAGAMTIRNSILWADQPNDIVSAGAVAVMSSNLTGTYPALSAFDPGFVNPTGGDYSLLASSPCIDTANDTIATWVDRVGHARRDEPGVPLCPVEEPSCGSIADMGAYEYGY